MGISRDHPAGFGGVSLSPVGRLALPTFAVSMTDISVVGSGSIAVICEYRRDCLRMGKKIKMTGERDTTPPTAPPTAHSIADLNRISLEVTCHVFLKRIYPRLLSTRHFQGTYVTNVSIRLRFSHRFRTAYISLKHSRRLADAYHHKVYLTYLLLPSSGAGLSL
jgi:hypothetical protein